MVNVALDTNNALIHLLVNFKNTDWFEITQEASEQYN